ncbi:MAG: DNA replication/repair protein RecF [Xanthomonadales bacterium]|nr:DNA replication/repair protein RecF [Xanthomonadales bacterium]
MLIETLQLENFRNLSQVRIEAHPRLNVLFGANGAGKTSILESVVVLSRGRSFRTTQANELIGPDKASFTIYALTQNQVQKRHRLGLERAGRHWRARCDGRELTQLSQLTRELPTVLVEPNSHLLVSGPPETRRKFLDWGVFHVEHEFLDVWRRYSRALKQRNSALRAGRLDMLDGLDQVLVLESARLTRLRRAHAEAVGKAVQVLLTSLSGELKPITLRYQPGWAGESYEEALRVGREKDLERGVTGSGPHRADLAMLQGRAPVRAVLSRGEQKILSSALLLCQAHILAHTGETPLLLLDDLASEFDQEHFDNVLTHAVENRGQVWLTGTRKVELSMEHKVFHVEHGDVVEML